MKKIIPAIILFAFMLASCYANQGNEKLENKSTTDNSSKFNNESISQEVIKKPRVEIINRLFPEKFSSEREGEISFVMLHFSSNVIENKKSPYDVDKVLNIFMEYYTSPHYLIDREGVIYQCVDESRTAWHAGKGEWGNDEKYTNKMNEYSIGIEILGIGSYNDMKKYLSEKEYNSINKSDLGFTEKQYDSILELLQDIDDRYKTITFDKEHIISHEDYAPDRKTDPGELFDWQKIGLDE